MNKKRIALLGATGSIGMAALKVIRQHPDRFQLVSVAAGRQWDKLLPVIQEFNLGKACLWEEAAAAELRRHTAAKVFSGMDGLLELCADADVDFVLNGLVGAIGCRPTLEAIRHGKHVGLANKETMVMAGAIINEALSRHPESRMIPIDSEHSAIFQCLAGRPVSEVEHIELTASGGPFRERPQATFATITKSDALKHPTWKMGAKITIDSATLMNKGLEVIEAHYLFGMDFNRIKVTIHPTSIIHSFVQFRDGSLMAQLGCPDMQLPIQYAMTYPERWSLDVERLDLAKVAKLEFFPPDFEKFPCLGLAYRAGSLGGTAPAVLNAANEAVVARFLEESIAFTDIPIILSQVLEQAALSGQSAQTARTDTHAVHGLASKASQPTLDDVLKADAWARAEAEKIMSRGIGKTAVSPAAKVGNR